jgi:hypothetical protein
MPHAGICAGGGWQQPSLPRPHGVTVKLPTNPPTQLTGRPQEPVINTTRGLRHFSKKQSDNTPSSLKQIE